ncbi:amino acid adenylation domain-containing protein [Pseudomonas gingeri]|uniref:amino acid adenylation domain-containing protein n=1 Tax=Pseudomonas gingeri TaxID=117681 RepID=UPI0015A1888F|nr:amino acid adenylation domain-containing protein [Pseudomonas gingeri]NWA27648.1 amino acid adenylation domain-containing protein [Pseudomonas gingeri]
MMNLGLPLSAQQKHLAEGGHEAWHWLRLSLPGVAAETLRGRLLDVLQGHEALRLRYVRPEGATGLRQIVAEGADVDLDWRQADAASADFSTWQAAARQHLRDRAQRPDVLAWSLGEQLLLAFPVCSLDLRSVVQLQARLLGVAPSVPDSPDAEPAMQYGQYSEWVNGLLQDEDAEQGAQFWRNLNFAQAPGLRLIERYGQASGEREAVSQALSPSTLAALQALARRESVSLEQLLLAAWGALLGRLKGQAHAQLVLMHDPRDDYEELAGAYGLFEQPLPLLMQLSAQSNWLSLARQLARQVENAVDWQEYVAQAQVLPDWRGALQAGLRLLHAPASQVLEPLSFDGPVELLLHCSLDAHGAGQLLLIHDNGLYLRGQITLLLRRYHAWLDNLLSHSQSPLDEVSALLADDALVMQTPVPAQADADLVTSFREHARRQPTHPALRDGGWLLSYAELDRLSDVVAGHLHRAGAGAEQVVGLYLPRGAQMLIAMLACFKAGAAYLPLDPQQPPLRLQGILDDARPRLLLHLDDLAAETSIPGLSWSAVSAGTPWTESSAPAPEQLAYVLYTSGTSGKPKGVQIEHGQLRHYVNQVSQALQLPQGGHYGLVSSLLADLGNTVLYPAWLQGGCVHLLSQTVVTDAQAFAEELARHPLDVLKIVPSHLEALMGEREPTAVLPRQVLVLGGEPIGDSLANRLSAAATDCRVYNHYGPTETTVGVLWRRFDPLRGSLGAALDQVIGDNRIYLLDESRQPVPPGQVAEVYVAGSSVGRGYVGGTEVGAGAFGQDPFAAGRCYRTGDLALRQADGALRLLGRNDQQVKIRGFRLELAEVEVALRDLPGIEQAAVLLDGSGEHARLLAFVVEDSTPRESTEQRQQALAGRLPDYMRPALIVSMRSLPLNANGKLDGTVLLERARLQQSSTRVAPVGALETAVLEIWCSALGVETLGVMDNFFAVGGHSLAAIKVVSMIRERLGLNPPTNLLFSHQTVRELVGSLAQAASGHCRLLRAAADDAPVLLVVHGAQGHLQAYTPLIAGLDPRFAVYGLSALEEDWQPQVVLDTLLERYVQSIPAALKSRPLHLLGWSLASRLALLLIPHLLRHGFQVGALLVLDHDPQRDLAGEGDESGQLLADLAFFCRSRQQPLPPMLLDRLSAQLSVGTYAECVQQLLEDPQLREHLQWQVEDPALQTHLTQYRRIKVALYEQRLPVVDVPILLWRGNAHGDLRATWQAHSSRPLRDWTVDLGHHEMLTDPLLLDSLHAALPAPFAEAPSIS